MISQCWVIVGKTRPQHQQAVSGLSLRQQDMYHFGPAGGVPKLWDQSWHVEVFGRQVVYLGLFRQSRVIGKWFMGKHSVHIQGRDLLERHLNPA